MLELVLLVLEDIMVSSNSLGTVLVLVDKEVFVTSRSALWEGVAIAMSEVLWIVLCKVSDVDGSVVTASADGKGSLEIGGEIGAWLGNAWSVIKVE